MLDINKFKLAEKRYEGLEDIQGDGLSFWKDVRITFLKNKAAVISLVFLLLILIFAIVGPMTGYYGTLENAGAKQDLSLQFLPPRVPILEKIPFIGSPFNGEINGVNMYEGIEDKYFLFGTDTFGRDMWVRVWVGVRISLFIGFTATMIDLIIGVTFGGVSGYFGGKVDMVMQRVLEVLSAVPMLIVIILLVLVLEPGIIPIIIALGITGWIGMCRMVRGKFMSIKEQEYVYAARTLGTSHAKIIFKHLLPNTYPTIVVWLMFTIPGAIFYEAFLSFIGLGVSIPNSSLGSLINDGRAFLTYNQYLLIIPAVVLSLIMIAFNLVANGMRDASDPKTRGEK